MRARTYREAKEDEEEAVDSAALHQEATDSVCGFESVVEPSPQREREGEEERTADSLKGEAGRVEAGWFSSERIEVPRFINGGGHADGVSGPVTGGAGVYTAACRVLRVTFTAQHPLPPFPAPVTVVDSVGGCARSGPRRGSLGSRTWWGGEGRGAGCRCTAEQPSSVDATAPSPGPQNPSSPRPSVNDLRANDSHSLSLSRRPEPSSPPLLSRGSQFVYIGAGLLIAIDPHPSRPVGIRTAADGGEGEDRGRPSNLEEDRRLRR